MPRRHGRRQYAHDCIEQTIMSTLDESMVNLGMTTPLNDNLYICLTHNAKLSHTPTYYSAHRILWPRRLNIGDKYLWRTLWHSRNFEETLDGSWLGEVGQRLALVQREYIPR